MDSNHIYKNGAPNGGTPFLTAPTRKVWMRGSAVVAGNHVRADTARSQAVETVANSRGLLLPAVANWNVGPALVEMASCLNNFVLPASGLTVMTGHFALALESVAKNELLEVLEVGVVNNVAKVVHASAATYPAGSPLAVTNAGAALTILTTLSAGTDPSAETAFKIVGMLVEPATIAVGGTAVVAPSIFFNGYGLSRTP